MRCILLVASFIFSLGLFAQWNPNITINTPVCIQQKSQKSTHIVTDGSNGAVICWEDSRTSTVTSTDIYAQRMNASGIAKWAGNGVAVCSNNAAQASPAITEVGNGEVIIVWEDLRNGNYDIFAQKLDSLGNSVWANGGIAVCSKTTNQKGPKILNDGAGGAVIVWEDSLNFYWDIYAQRVSSSGSILWGANGVAVCNAQNTQNNPRLDFGLSGGAIITWQDKRNNNDYDIYAQSLDGNGVAQWTANGVVLCNSINTQSNPRIEPDGSGGAVIAWEDKRNGSDYNIYSQRVNATGVIQWTSNGIAIVNAATNQSAADMKYTGAGKIVYSWKDLRTGNYTIYTQIVDLAGNIQLPSNGVQLSSALKSINPNTISDGTGGVIIAWQDSTVSGWNITSQKINSSGQAQWTNGGLTVSNATDDQINVSQVSDNAGGAIYVWDDHRNTIDYDIYCQKIYSSGSTAVGIEQLKQQSSQDITCYPNPAQRTSAVRLAGVENTDRTVSIYDAFGKSIFIKSAVAGEDLILNMQCFEPGLYFYEVKVKGVSQTVTGKFICTRD